MPVSVIIGGQFGSEGKGKTTLFFAEKQKARAIVRVGGPNSGHTVIDDLDHPLVLRQLPVAAATKEIYAVISSGSYINIEVLLREIDITKIDKQRLLIDPYAVLIQDDDVNNELGLMSDIASTGSGMGSAIINRIKRKPGIRFAKDEPRLRCYIQYTKPFLRKLLNENQRVLIEGTQGFGLSLLHSNLHPFTTSRDTSAAAFVSEAGLSPIDVDEIIMVIRTFPIRVGGNSGPLPNEIDWKYISDYSKSNIKLIEYTSVTKKIRRVALFDHSVVRQAIMVNCPTKIVLNHIDYIDANCRNGLITLNTQNEILEIERQIGKKIDYLGMDRNTLYEKDNCSILEMDAHLLGDYHCI